MDKKYESDLTPREKRQLELQKLKNMNTGQKIDYLWTYYKWVLVVILIVILVIYLGVTMYRNIRTTELLSIAVIDADTATEENQARMEEDLLEWLQSGKGYEEVSVDTSIQSGEDYVSTAKRVATIGSGAMDLLICGEEAYDSFAEQDVFLSWEEVLGDQYQTYEPYLVDGKLDLSRSEKWQSYHLASYEPAYAGVYVSSENSENVVKFLEYFFEVAS